MKNLALAAVLSFAALGFAGCSGSTGAVTPSVAVPVASADAAEAVRLPSDVIGGAAGFMATIDGGDPGLLSVARSAERLKTPAGETIAVFTINGHTVTGHLYQSGRPFADGKVQLAPAGSLYSAYTTYSGDSGSFKFHSVVPGSYSLAVNGVLLPTGAVNLTVTQ